MAEIARLAGVSESTVSRALRGSPRITEATRKRIADIAAAEGYAVNASASRLRLQSSGSLGLIIPLVRAETDQPVTDPFFLEIIGAITEAVTERGYDLILALPGEPGHVSRNRLLTSGKADGLIVIGQSGRHERLNELAAQGAPLVAWGGRLKDQRYVTVGSDNLLGGRLATEHLLGLGRSRLLFLGDIRLPEVELRHQGFLGTLADAGLSPHPRLYLPASYTAREVDRLVRETVAAGHAFDAIFAASDLIAISAMRTLRDLGRKVPDDVSIVGYDDISLASYISPALTTISQDLSGGGARLVSLLLKAMAGEDIASEFTETKLIVRDS